MVVGMVREERRRKEHDSKLNLPSSRSTALNIRRLPHVLGASASVIDTGRVPFATSWRKGPRRLRCSDEVAACSILHEHQIAPRCGHSIMVPKLTLQLLFLQGRTTRSKFGVAGVRLLLRLRCLSSHVTGPADLEQLIPEPVILCDPRGILRICVAGARNVHWSSNNIGAE